MNIDVKKILIPALMVSFRSSHKISSYLVRSNLCPSDRVVGLSRHVKGVTKTVVTFQRWTHLLVLPLAKHAKGTISIIVMASV